MVENAEFKALCPLMAYQNPLDGDNSKLLNREYNIFTAKIDLENEFIDLTISDVMMPAMDGINFRKYVKNKFEIQHVPVILLTAENKEGDHIETYDSGTDGFISKPFSLSVLHSKIKNLLKTKERTVKKFKEQFVLNIENLDYTSVDEDFLNRAVDCVHKNIVIEDKKAIHISELAYAVGFNAPKYFSSCFKKEFGLIPSEYLDQIMDNGQEKENFDNNTDSNK
jgi:response regulator RpfG family c-di-GMP phosphodiesterase